MILHPHRDHPKWVVDLGSPIFDENSFINGHLEFAWKEKKFLLG